MDINVLILASLNKFGDMHGYDLKKMFEQSHVSEWGSILVGSIYHSLKQLEKFKLIEVKKIESTGLKSKAVYGITKKGKLDLKLRILDSLENLNTSLPSNIYLNLIFLDEVDSIAGKDKIANSIKLLEKRHKLWKESESKKTGDFPNNAILKLIFENGLKHIEEDIKLLKKIQTGKS
jgi:DNA-binding PadR family transcriptional regulator